MSDLIKTLRWIIGFGAVAATAITVYGFIDGRVDTLTSLLLLAVCVLLVYITYANIQVISRFLRSFFSSNNDIVPIGVLDNFSTSLTSAIIKTLKESRDSIDDDAETLLSIYQFGSMAHESSIDLSMSNVNFFVFTSNSEDSVFLMNNFEKISYYINNDSNSFNRYGVDLFSNFVDDKKSPLIKKRIKCLLLIRPKEHLFSKKKRQPFFVLNVLENNKHIFGFNAFSSIMDIELVESVTTESLLHQQGGIVELQLFLINAFPIIETSPLSYLRCFKYVILRSVQMFMMHKIKKVVHGHRDIYDVMKEYLNDGFFVGVDQSGKKVADGLKAVIGGNVTSSMLEYGSLKKLNKHAMVFLQSIRSTMENYIASGENKYVTYESIEAQEALVREVVSTANIEFDNETVLVVLTNSIDDPIAASLVYKLFYKNVKIAYFLARESDSIVRRFDLNGRSALFRYAPDDLPSSGNIFVLYVGSGAVVGKHVTKSINRVIERYEISSCKWGYVLINSNPNEIPSDDWLKDFIVNLRESVHYKNSPSIEVVHTVANGVVHNNRDCSFAHV